MEARIHIAEPAPPYCAACHQAVPEKVHVDFGASFDGPMLPALTGTIGVVGHSIDEVIICETCLAEAAKLLGLGDVEKFQDELAAERAVNEGLHEQLAATREGVVGALDHLRGRLQGEVTPPPHGNSLLPIGPVPPARPVRPRRGAGRRA